MGRARFMANQKFESDCNMRKSIFNVSVASLPLHCTIIPLSKIPPWTLSVYTYVQTVSTTSNRSYLLGSPRKDSATQNRANTSTTAKHYHGSKITSHWENKEQSLFPLPRARANRIVSLRGARNSFPVPVDSCFSFGRSKDVHWNKSESFRYS